MRRVVMIATLVTLLVALLAPVALAAIQCRYNPCFGTDQPDRLVERKGQGLNDAIYGKDRGDVIDADNYIRDHDELLGQRGDDTLRAQDEDGADTLKGGKGFDTCFADSGDVVYSCEELDQPPPES
jgi:hemolysin type calcium-binding protein